MNVIKDDENKILKYIDEKRDDIIEFLKTLISYRTPNPPGRNTSRPQKWIAKKLSSIGFKTETFEVFPGDPNVVGVLKGVGEGRSVILNGHIDVAEVREEGAWKHEPFIPRIERGLMFGRGASDMKGGLTAMIMAMDAIRENGYSLKGDVIIESVVGEEMGEEYEGHWLNGTTKCIDRGYKADLAIIPEPSNFKVGGQGGVLTAWIIIKSPVTLHNGVRRQCIHAGGGIEGASAIEKMYKIIAALQELERYWAVMKIHPFLPPGSNTINPAVIEGGIHPAFIANECRLWITVHYLPNETREKIIEEVEDHIKKSAEADPWLKNNPPTVIWWPKASELFPPAEISPDHLAIQMILQNHKKISARETRIEMWPSVCDVGWLAKAGMTAIIYGPGSLEQAHNVDEFVKIEDVIIATKSLALTLLDWCDYI